MDLLSYFRVLRRRWLVILACVLVGAVIGVASTLLDSKQAKTRTYYKATNTQIYDNSTSGPVPSVVNNIDQIAVLVTSGTVPDSVAKKLGTEEIGRQLAEKIVTTTNSVTNTVDITATDASPKRAVALADEFAKQITASLVARDTAKYDAERDDLQQQLDQLKSQANGFLAQLATTPKIPDFDTVQKQYDATQNQYYDVYGQLQSLTSAGAPTSRLSTLESAQSIPISQGEYDARLNLGALGENHLRADSTGATSTPQSLAPPSKPSLFESKSSRGVLGAFLGLLVGIGLAVVLDRLDKRIRTRSEAEAAFGLPVLAEVPNFQRSQAKNRELLAHTQPQSRTANAFRAIKTSLMFQQSGALGVDRNAKVGAPIEGLYESTELGSLVVMVTSASPREGKTTTSANLAVVFAETGENVLIVNCDFRRPTIHQHFGVDDIPRTVQSTLIPNLKIVTNVLADPNANPAQIVAAQRQVVAAARDRFSVIILDTAPMLTANDAIEAVGVADLVLLVARANVTTTDRAERSMEILTRLEAPLGGVVLVATEQPTSDYYYYYQRGRLGGKQKRTYTTGAPLDVPTNGNGNAHVSAAPSPAPTNGSSATTEPAGEQHPS
jgi:Mrp family chromosome partitioning ATPase/capsular polysaccharide biosynthesis protein